MAKASDVAEFYIAMYEDSEDRMTNLRINKFLYFAQGWCIARLGRPLFDEEILQRVRVNKSVEARKVIGGSARSAVRENIRSITRRLNRMFKD